MAAVTFRKAPTVPIVKCSVGTMPAMLQALLVLDAVGSVGVAGLLASVLTPSALTLFALGSLFLGLAVGVDEVMSVA